MRGSVVKKGTRWYVKIELDPDAGTGRRRQKWHSGYSTKREAERARIDLLSKFERRVRRALSPDCRRLLRRLVACDRAHRTALDVQLVLPQRPQSRGRPHRFGAADESRRWRLERAVRAAPLDWSTNRLPDAVPATRTQFSCGPANSAPQSSRWLPRPRSFGRSC